MSDQRSSSGTVDALRDKLASLKWHIVENTVNKEIIVDLIEDCQRLAGAAQAAPLPDREQMAEILYTAAHKGLRNCWKWSDAELDHEHPTSRGYWYKIAD